MNLNKNLKSKLMSLGLVVIAILLLVGCSAPQEELYIFAASSLQDSLEEMATLYKKQYPDVSLHFNFAGSNILKGQIIEGFEADLFLSAHVTQYEALVELERVEKGEIFARNQVVLVSSSDAIESFYDLANDGVSLIFANDAVPIGVYTEFILEQVDAIIQGLKQLL